MARGRGHSPLLFLLLLIVVVLAVFGVMCGLSVSRIQDHMNKADADYQSFNSELEAGQYDEAMASLEGLSSEWKAVDTEMSAWYWQAARYVPVLGEDVGSMQSMASIAKRLANDGVLPVATDAKGIFDGLDGTITLDVLTQKATQIGQFIKTLDTCRGVVSQCNHEAQALPEGHLGFVNDCRKQIVDQASQIDEAYESIDALLDLANLAGLTG